MKISVIICTRNRSYTLNDCLDSVAVAAEQAALASIEVIVVDNGSTDDTAKVVQAWSHANTMPVQLLSVPQPGKSRALNHALRAAQGELLAFTDDDCRLDRYFIVDMLRYDAEDTAPVLRGGQIALGDPTDLPITINTYPRRKSWSLAQRSARHHTISGKINGCNMVMRRTLFEQIGFFDENFGPGAVINSGEDTDYMFRTYIAGIPLEHVPDMTVYHHHGRKDPREGFKLWKDYMIGAGALDVKYIFKHPDLCRSFWWDVKNACKELMSGKKMNIPATDMSHKHKVFYALTGAILYVINFI